MSNLNLQPISRIGQFERRVGRLTVSPQLVAGLILLAVAWPIAWFGNPPLSEHTFFSIWLGYVLSVDGLVLARSGSSLLTRSRIEFLGLFIASIPLWWLFELANHFIGNWTYLRAHEVTWVQTRLEASFSFATVIPAIFVTAELYSTTRLGRRSRKLIPIRPSRRGLLFISIGGCALFALSLAVPNVFFPFVWIGLFFAVDPLNALLGQPSIARQVARNDWSTVVILFAAGLTCGFFWEMWNFWSMPKWVYDISFAERFHLFEMPVLGYGGYLPFALEVYAIYNLLRWPFGIRTPGFLSFDDQEARANSTR